MQDLTSVFPARATRLPAYPVTSMLVVGLTFGAIGAAVHSTRWFLALVPIWFAVVVLARRAPLIAPGSLRFCAALTWAWSATMLGTLFTVSGPAADRPPGSGLLGHPAVGEHPVRVLAGLPWPGLEGNGNGLAAGFVPFAMGGDALLVNFTAFVVVILLATRRNGAATARDSLVSGSVVALFATIVGGWQIAWLFD